MRILASHFALSPQGEFYKFPMLYLDNNNRVTCFEEKGAQFKETPSTEFFGGLMVPGFIVDLSFLSPSVDLNVLKQVLNRLYRDGVQYIVMPSSLKTILDNQVPYLTLKIIYVDGVLVQDRDLSKILSPWSALSDSMLNGGNRGVAQVLYQYLLQPWDQSGFSHLGGKFEIGYQPGVLLITGIDWTSMNFTLTARIQRLHD